MHVVNLFWGIKTYNSSSTFHFTCRGFTGLKRREFFFYFFTIKLIPRRTAVAVECVEASGVAAQPESLQHRRWHPADSSHAFMNLLLACHYGWMLSAIQLRESGRFHILHLHVDKLAVQAFFQLTGRNNRYWIQDFLGTDELHLKYRVSKNASSFNTKQYLMSSASVSQ